MALVWKKSKDTVEGRGQALAEYRGFELSVKHRPVHSWQEHTCFVAFPKRTDANDRHLLKIVYYRTNIDEVCAELEELFCSLLSVADARYYEGCP